MAILTYSIPTYAIARKSLVMDTDLLKVLPDYTAWAGYDIRVKNNSGTNWTKTDATTVLFSEVVSDESFDIPLEATTDDINWEDCGSIRGTVYSSIGTTNISISLIKTVLGSSENTLSLLCQAPPVNKYSLYKPSGSSPYRIGDFKYYTHGLSGGLILDEKIAIDNQTQKTGYIDYGSTANILGFASKYAVETTNRPFSSSRLRIYKGSTLIEETSTVDMTSSDVMSISKTITNESTTEVVENDWSLQSWHLYSGTWYVDKTLTFSVYKSGLPWSITFASQVLVTGDTGSFTVNWTYSSGGTLPLRMKIGTVYSYVGRVDDETIVINYDELFHPESGLWVLQIQFNSIWYDALSGDISD